MYYRRKIILSLLQVFDNQLQKLSLQKLLFLFTRQQDKPEYDFVPYKFGCFSFSANADLIAMTKHGLLMEEKNGFSKIDQLDYISKLTEKDRENLFSVKKLYGKLSSDALMKLTYLNYHYHAINSVKAEEILMDEDYRKISEAKPKNDKIVLYTIGYEGISLEEYLNRLVRNDVKVLVDVRKNAMSMKFGFSKSQLKNYCNSLNIGYIHVPEVGIQSDWRQELNTQSDYDSLFEKYKESNLTETVSHQEYILNLLIQKQRIALTCFEADICQCHRKHLAEAITRFPQWNYELKHI